MKITGPLLALSGPLLASSLTAIAETSGQEPTLATEAGFQLSSIPDPLLMSMLGLCFVTLGLLKSKHNPKHK